MTHDEALRALAAATGAAIVQPGDMLIIGISKPTIAEELDTLVKALRGQGGIPESIQICIIESVSGMAVIPGTAA